MRGKIPINIPDDARNRAIAFIRRAFAENLDSEIGDLTSAPVLDYFHNEHGPTAYNQAIGDARSFLKGQAADLGAMYHHVKFPHWDTRKGSQES